MLLTTRDHQILDAIATRVRLLSLEQIRFAWWAESKIEVGERLARKRLLELERNGFVEKIPVLARALPDITKPVCTWHPGGPTPNFGAISYQLQSRWTETPRQRSVYVIASKGAGLFGVSAKKRVRSDYQCTHDLGTSQVYVQYLRDSPELATRWIGEDLLAGTGAPDAVLAESLQSEPERIIEFGGAYDTQKIRRFFQKYETSTALIEIW